MFNLVQRLGCLAIIALALFFFVSFWTGGDQFRDFGKKAGIMVDKVTAFLSGKADELKGEAEDTKKRIQKSTQKGRE